MRSKSHFRGTYRSTKPQIPVLIKPYIRSAEQPNYHSPQAHPRQNQKSSQKIPMDNFPEPKRMADTEIVSPTTPQPEPDTNEIDDFFGNSSQDTIWKDMENFLQSKLQLVQCTVFLVNGIHRIFYSPTQSLIIPFYSSLLAKPYSSKINLYTTTPLQHPDYSSNYDQQFIPENCPLVIIPLLSNSPYTPNISGNKICALVQCTRNTFDETFSSFDMKFVEIFQHKFLNLSKWMFQESQPVPSLSDYLHLQSPSSTEEDLPNSILARLTETYNALSAQIWILDNSTNKYTLFTYGSPTGSKIDVGIN